MQIKSLLMGTTSNKDFNSAVIVTWAVILVFLVTKLFPGTITGEMQTGFMVAVLAVIVNKIREVNK